MISSIYTIAAWVLIAVSHCCLLIGILAASSILFVMAILTGFPGMIFALIVMNRNDRILSGLYNKHGKRSE